LKQKLPLNRNERCSELSLCLESTRRNTKR